MTLTYCESSRTIVQQRLLAPACLALAGTSSTLAQAITNHNQLTMELTSQRYVNHMLAQHKSFQGSELVLLFGL